MDGPELLRRFCIGDPTLADHSGELWSRCLDDRTRDLVRIGALIAMSAPVVSLRSAIDDALSAGVATKEWNGTTVRFDIVEARSPQRLHRATGSSRARRVRGAA